MAANSERGDPNQQQAFPTQAASNRENCPTPDLLQAVAAKSLPFDHPVVQHVGLCDFCLADVNVMRHARKRRRTLVSVAGFVAAIAITFGIVLSRQVYGPGSKPTTEMALDLRPFAPSRDDQTAAAPPTPLLPRENVAVSAELPLGSETGKYEIRLMDDQLRVVQQTSGAAALQNHEVRLSVRLDLRKLAPGGYRLWIRREDRSWRDYPLEIR